MTKERQLEIVRREILERPVTRRRAFGLSGLLAAASMLPVFDNTPVRLFATLGQALAQSWVGYEYHGTFQLYHAGDGWHASAEESYRNGWIYYNSSIINQNNACGADTSTKLCRFTVDLVGGCFISCGEVSPPAYATWVYSCGIYRGTLTVMPRYGTGDYEDYFGEEGFRKTGYVYRGLYNAEGTELLWDQSHAICPGHWNRAYNGYWMNDTRAPAVYLPDGSWWHPYWHGADQAYGIVKWEPITYGISYSLSGGSFGNSHPTQATYDVPFAIDNPKRTGYAFSGWSISGMSSARQFDIDYNPSKYLGSSSGSLSAFSADTLSGRKETWYKNLRTTSGTVNFTASWTPFKLTVRYHPNNELSRDFKVSDSNNGGRAAGDPMRTDTFSYNGTDLASSGLPDLDGGTWKLVRQHYTTTGNWLVGSSNSSKKVSEATKYAKVQDFANAIGYGIDTQDRTVDLYAEWKVKQYTVTYYRDGEVATTKKLDALTQLGADGGWAPSNAHRDECKSGVEGGCWFTDAQGTSKFTGCRLEGDLKLYAFNLCDVTLQNSNIRTSAGDTANPDSPVYSPDMDGLANRTLDALTGLPQVIDDVRYGTSLTFASSSNSETVSYTSSGNRNVTGHSACAMLDVWCRDPDPLQPYHVFAEGGWYANASCTGSHPSSYTVRSNMTLWKHWATGGYEGVKS